MMNFDNIEHLLNEARKIFISNGYHGSSVRLLLKNLDISEKQFYDHLGGKRGLVKRLINYELLRWKNMFEKASQNSQDDSKQTLKDVIDALAKSHREEITPHGSFLANLTCELNIHERDILELIAHVYNSMADDIAKLLEGIDMKERSVNHREIALFVLGALEGSLIMAKSDNDFWEMKNGFEITKRFIESL